EFFGPVLGVVPFDSLDEAIEIANETGYGLTSGIHSLDEREIEKWKEGIRAGNLYINRGPVGAIVLRQPFGGMGKSSVGPGIKAGGPNYVVPLMQFDEANVVAENTGEIQQVDLLAELSRGLQQYLTTTTPPPIAVYDIQRTIGAIDSYRYWACEEFHASHDH